MANLSLTPLGGEYGRWVTTISATSTNVDLTELTQAFNRALASALDRFDEAGLDPRKAQRFEIRVGPYADAFNRRRKVGWYMELTPPEQALLDEELDTD